MNSKIEAIIVNETEQLPGWHGGLTKAESEIPIFFHYSGSIGPANQRSELLDKIRTFTNNIRQADPKQQLRNRHLKQIILLVRSELQKE